MAAASDIPQPKTRRDSARLYSSYKTAKTAAEKIAPGWQFIVVAHEEAGAINYQPVFICNATQLYQHRANIIDGDSDIRRLQWSGFRVLALDNLDYGSS